MRFFLKYVIGLFLLLFTLNMLTLSCGENQPSEPLSERNEFSQEYRKNDGSSVSESIPKEKREQVVEASRTEHSLPLPERQSRCVKKPSVVPKQAFFTDISKQSGIQSHNFIRNLQKKVPINDHSRLGFADINGDGFDDIIVHSLYPNPQAGVPFEHLVFLNNGDGTFKEFSDASGLRKIQAGFFLFGDVDNDGDQDCFAGVDIPLSGVTNQIYLNDGKGHFSLKKSSGVSVRNLLAMNAVFADFNNDGKLDLYIGSGGTSYRMPDSFFVGKGDGSFVNKTSTALTGNRPLTSNGTVTCDFDNDGDLDIIVSTYGVSNLLGHNILWQNDGKGNFLNVARSKGFEALAGGNYYLPSTGYGKTPEPGKSLGQYVGSNGFGVDCKDVNNDGYYDIFLTTISHANAGIYSRKWSDPTQLLINLGSASNFVFSNQFMQRKLSYNEGDVDGALVDFDNDGRLDISISRESKYERNYTKIEQKAWFGLFRQKVGGTFESLGPISGINSINAKNAASFALCDAGQKCPSGETCLLKRCRIACTKDADCLSPDEFCGSFWDAANAKPVLFCRQNLKMKGAQNHAWSDIDHDGDLDLLVGGRDKGGGRPNFLFRNDIGSKNRWMAIRLVGDGVKVNRDAIGARISLVFNMKKNAVITREVQSSRGTYNSSDTRVLHFGLAGYPCDYEIKLRWPDGTFVSIDASKLKENAYTTIVYPRTIKQ